MVALVLLAGGGKPVPTGRYRGERTVAVVPGTDPVVADQLRRVQITFRGDGTAELEDGGIPFEGPVTRRGDELRFEPLAVAGLPARRQDPAMVRPRAWRVLPDGSIEAEDVRLTPFP